MENIPITRAVRVRRNVPHSVGLTSRSQFNDNPNTDDCQDDGGLAKTRFRLDGLDMQLSEVYWV